jgi:hypothetical protein
MMMDTHPSAPMNEVAMESDTRTEVYGLRRAGARIRPGFRSVLHEALGKLLASNAFGCSSYATAINKATSATSKAPRINHNVASTIARSFCPGALRSPPSDVTYVRQLAVLPIKGRFCIRT